jgi:hypothetical protein
MTGLQGELGFQKRGGSWIESRQDGNGPAGAVQKVRVELHQGINTPPTLHAVDVDTQSERQIWDLNPDLKKRWLLGRVEEVHWTDARRETWGGVLYYPPDYSPAKRYPLVIQTHGYPPNDEFSLYGAGVPGFGLGPSYAVFAAQPLAGRGMMVLHLADKTSADILTSPKEPAVYMQAYEDAVQHFASLGLVDPSKVALVGYSRSGWHVEYALTHSTFPYAAAISADSFDGSYLQSLMIWSDEYSLDNGAAPFGEGLRNWLEMAPGFNLDRVQTPLWLEVQTAGLATTLVKWETFSRLRYLQKPVELYVAPNIDHGDHGIQNPGQCLAVQERAVDWLDFWLNNREDPVHMKQEQYVHWRTLRIQQQAMNASKQSEMLSRAHDAESRMRAPSQ